MESDLLGLDLSILDIDLVTNEDDWDVLADSHEILVPLWDVLVGDSGADIEHDDTAVSVDVVAISEATKLLLTGGVPNIEQDLAFSSEERHWIDLDTESSDVLLLELSSQMPLHESGLSDTTISDKDEFELSSLLSFHYLFEVKLVRVY